MTTDAIVVIVMLTVLSRAVSRTDPVSSRHVE